jgi:hypothetical protein
MKKLIVVLILVGAGGWLAWRKWARPEARACHKLQSLCGDKDDIAKCEEMFDTLKKGGGADVVDQPIQCILESNSCATAIGCGAAMGARLELGAMRDMLKGFGRALEDK